MRVLTVRQPWAWAIIHLGKDVENRSQNIAGAYRGPVAIHAGAVYDYSADEHEVIRELADRYGVASLSDYLVTCGQQAYRHIIGVVDLADVHHADDCFQRSLTEVARLYRTDRAAYDALPVHAPELGGIISRLHHCSPWAHGDGHHLNLANPRPLTTPIPYRGALGLRTITDPDVLARLALSE